MEAEMKAKIDLKKHGGRVKGAGELPQKAAGDMPNTGAPGPTPAPDVISTPRAAHSGYGQNNFGGPSSLTPLDDSNKGVSPLAANIKATSERGSDAVLDAVIRKGVGAGSIDPLTGDVVTMAEGVAGTQIRKTGAGNVPLAFGQQSAAARQPTYPGPKQSVPKNLSESDVAPKFSTPD
jgi:hypothetical protein